MGPRPSASAFPPLSSSHGFESCLSLYSLMAQLTFQSQCSLQWEPVSHPADRGDSFCTVLVWSWHCPAGSCLSPLPRLPFILRPPQRQLSLHHHRKRPPCPGPWASSGDDGGGCWGTALFPGADLMVELLRCISPQAPNSHASARDTYPALQPQRRADRHPWSYGGGPATMWYSRHTQDQRHPSDPTLPLGSRPEPQCPHL